MIFGELAGLCSAGGTAGTILSNNRAKSQGRQATPRANRQLRARIGCRPASALGPGSVRRTSSPTFGRLSPGEVHARNDLKADPVRTLLTSSLPDARLIAAQWREAALNLSTTALGAVCVLSGCGPRSAQRIRGSRWRPRAQWHRIEADFTGTDCPSTLTGRVVLTKG